MKILLIGAIGRTGKLVLKKALEKGDQVNFLARNIERFTKKDGLTIIEGNPNNENDLKNAIVGCHGVINVLNVS